MASTETIEPNLDEPIFVAGHNGMVGSAIVRRLKSAGYRNLLLRPRQELDLTEQDQVRRFFEREKPAVVYVAAARVGGIYANNTFPAEFIYQNIAIFTHIAEAAYHQQCRRLLFLGSSCIYPRLAPQPIPESALLAGPLEPTNEPYAIAKIAGIKMCDAYNRQFGTDYRSVMPTNLYGPNDNYDLKTSHVMPALLRKFREAQVAGAPTVEVWGSGNPRREFLHVDDMADACVFIMNLPKERFATVTSAMVSHINVGTGEDVAVRDLATIISEVAGYKGEIRFNPAYPDGTPRKLLDVSLLRSLGWQPKIGLREGIRSAYAWFRDNVAGQ